jgi:hypothetical protein
MTNIFVLDAVSDFSEKINIDELYEGKKAKDLNKLALFQKILNRVHVRIKTTSRQKKDENYCWYIVPEVIIGVPKYDQGECIAYILDKLQENGFMTQYFHPNTILIAWHHWIPAYVRNELKKKTGIIINEYGEKIDENDNKLQLKDQKINNDELILNNKDISQNIGKSNKKFTPITTYKPTGSLFLNSTNN